VLIPTQASGDRPHTMFMLSPMLSALRSDLALHDRDCIMQLQRSLFGVGGRFDEACQVALRVGQAAFLVLVGV